MWPALAQTFFDEAQCRFGIRVVCVCRGETKRLPWFRSKLEVVMKSERFENKFREDYSTKLFSSLLLLSDLRKEFEVPPYSQKVELGSQIELRCHPPGGKPKPRVSCYFLEYKSLCF